MEKEVKTTETVYLDLDNLSNITLLFYLKAPYQAGQYYSMQGPVLDKTFVVFFFFPSFLHSPSGTELARHQE